MRGLKKSFFHSIRYYFNILIITKDINALCITRNCIEDISKIMYFNNVITYNTLKNIRALAGAIVNKRILK